MCLCFEIANASKVNSYLRVNSYLTCGKAILHEATFLVAVGSGYVCSTRNEHYTSLKIVGNANFNRFKTTFSCIP